MTPGGLRFHFTTSSTSFALFSKMKIAMCLRVGPGWRGNLGSIWGKHFTSWIAPHSWEEGLSFQGICCGWFSTNDFKWPNKAYLSKLPWEAYPLLPHLLPGLRECLELPPEPVSQRHMRDLVGLCIVSLHSWPRHPCLACSAGLLIILGAKCQLAFLEINTSLQRL